jgi:hypothetical protein
MTTIKSQVQKKLTYYQSQINNSVDRFIQSNKRVDRDTLMSYRAKVQVCKELLQLIENEK